MRTFRTSIRTLLDALAAAALFGAVALIALGFLLIAGTWWLIAVCWPVILPVIGLLYLLGWLA